MRYLGAAYARSGNRQSAEQVIVQLEQRLAKHEGPWSCGDRFTLADVVWAASLFRMRWIGIGHLFDSKSSCRRVGEYAERLFARAAFRSAIFDWPGAHAPSPHVPEMNTLGFKARFFWTLWRRS